MAKVIQLAADGSVQSSEQKEGFIAQTIAGLGALSGDATKAYTGDIIQKTMLVTHVANVWATSKFTRKRAGEGKAPVVGLFF